MVNLNIALPRLHKQFITQPTFTKPDDVVRSLGPIQAQDYAGAKWALGLRLQNATENTLEQACNDGTILRTQIFVGYLHSPLHASMRLVPIIIANLNWITHCFRVVTSCLKKRYRVASTLCDQRSSSSLSKLVLPQMTCA